MRASVSNRFVSLGLLLTLPLWPACGDDTTSADGMDTGGDDSTGTTSGTGDDTTSGIPTTTTGETMSTDTSTGLDDSSSGTSESTGSSDGSSSSESSTGPANDDPVAEDDYYVTSMAADPFTVDATEGVLVNDSDVNGDPLQVSDADVQSVAGGAVNVAPDGSFTYTPPSSFWGHDSFTYTVSDGAGGTDTATVVLMVAPTLIPGEAVGNGLGGFVIDGEAVNDESGQSVSALGDLDGDGRADILVGAPGGNAAYLVLGKDDGAAVSLTDVAAEAGGFTYVPETGSSDTGISVSLAGDVDGDGLADAVLGEPNVGRAYVVFGVDAPTNVSLDDVVAGNGGFVIAGGSPGDDLGAAVSAAGDVDGDGLADVIVGAPRAAAANLTSGGRAFVVFGKVGDTASVGVADIVAGTGGFVIEAEDNGDELGSAVSGAGDVNGDGLDDVIVGAPLAENAGAFAGRAYVVFGKKDGAAVSAGDLASGGGFIIEGEEALDNAGFSVSGAGDVNGDGRADLVIGARGAENDLDMQGRAYVVFGKSDTTTVLLTDIAQGNGGFVIDGESANDLAGQSVGGGIDVNGDGLSDVIVGAHLADFMGTNAGRAYVIYGKTDTTAVSLTDVVGGLGGFALDGVGGQTVGWASSGGADIDGDGFGDVVVGAPRADIPASDAGRTFVIFGGNFTGAVTLRGTPAADQLIGTGDIDVIVSGSGDDEIHGGGGADVLYAGPGADTIVIPSVDFFRIDGGPGEDTLALDGDGIALALGNFFAPAIRGIEVVDLTGSGDNSLFVTLEALPRLSPTSNGLRVIGDAGDSITGDLSGAGFVNNGVVDGFTEYSNGVLTVWVDEDLTDNLVI